MNILLIGSGGREHALASSIAKSKHLNSFFASPGSSAISKLATCISLDLKKSENLLSFIKQEKIELVVVGPEAPLVDGVADVLRENGVLVFGPGGAGAALEASKRFTKDLCKKYHIPTAAYEVFNDADQAKNYLEKSSYPLVIKADGLAAGKGVIIAQTLEEAKHAVDEILLTQKLGKQTTLVIESFLKGEEASFMIVTDGKTYEVLASSQDHKRLQDGDCGPNTGGMGAYSPAPVVTEKVYQKTIQKIIEPTLAALKAEGIDYRGVLYAGLMIENEEPELLEYNVRFGDPECEVILPRLKSDLVELMQAVAQGRLSEVKLEWDSRVCVGVVLAAEGYPENPVKGDEILGLEKLQDKEDVFAFHAGVKEENKKYYTQGGRVLVVGALGEDLKKATKTAYEAINLISWRGMQYRKDIAKKGMK